MPAVEQFKQPLKCHIPEVPDQETTGEVTDARLRGRILGFGCFLLLCGIFYAGLKPFHASVNEVDWLPDSSGVQFGEHGTMLSAGEFPASSAGTGRSVELWIQPTFADDTSTILGFYDPGSARRWSLRQSEGDLDVRIDSSSAWRTAKTDRMHINNAFGDKRRAFCCRDRRLLPNDGVSKRRNRREIF